MSLPVYDKPVYDYDIFDGVPRLNTSGSVNYDVFSTVSGSKQKQNDAFDDLFGGFGRKDRSRRDLKMSRMLGLDLMICFMGLVGLVLQVIGIDFLWVFSQLKFFLARIWILLHQFG